MSLQLSIEFYKDDLLIDKKDIDVKKLLLEGQRINTVGLKIDRIDLYHGTKIIEQYETEHIIHVFERMKNDILDYLIDRLKIFDNYLILT